MRLVLDYLTFSRAMLRFCVVHLTNVRRLLILGSLFNAPLAARTPLAADCRMLTLQPAHPAPRGRGFTARGCSLHQDVIIH